MVYPGPHVPVLLQQRPLTKVYAVPILSERYDATWTTMEFCAGVEHSS